MNDPAVLAVVLLLVLAVLLGNTMIAFAFLKGSKDKFKGGQSRDDRAIEELHQRVRDLPRKDS